VVKQVAWKISNTQNADNAVLLKELKTLSMPNLAHENICQMVMHVNMNGTDYTLFKTGSEFIIISNV